MQGIKSRLTVGGLRAKVRRLEKRVAELEKDSHMPRPTVSPQEFDRLAALVEELRKELYAHREPLL